MHSISLICVALAAAIYYYIFYLEYPAYGSARSVARLLCRLLS